jgi:hypothetical protein
VTRGVGAGVGAAVAAAVGAAVAAAVGVAVGTAVATGDAAAAGTDDAATADGEAAGLASIEGDELATGALAPALGSTDGDPPGGDVGGWDSGAVVGTGDACGADGGTTAIGPLERSVPSACCWSLTPPMPSAIVASTRFRTPRLRMSRTR